MHLKKNLPIFLFFHFFILSFAILEAQELLELDSSEKPAIFRTETTIFESDFVSPRATFSHTEGRFLDLTAGYTSIGLFSILPNSKNYYTTFFDVKGHFFNYEGRKAANAGFGLRYQKEENSWIYGINTYYDYREAAFHHAYHQVGLGLEFLGPKIDFRLNGYLPVGNAKAHSRNVRFDCSPGYYSIFQNQQTAQGGVDGEIGSWIITSSSNTPLTLYTALGGYYYASKKYFKSDFGVKARLESHFLNYFTFEIRGGYDDIYHGMGQGTLSVAIPLETFFKGLANLKATPANRLYQPVKRQDILFLSKKGCYWRWNF